MNLFQKKRYISRLQRDFVQERLNHCVILTLKRFTTTKCPVEYEGSDHDMIIAQQVIDGVRVDLQRELDLALNSCVWKWWV